MIEFSKLPVNRLPFDGYLTLNGGLLMNSEKKVYAGVSIDPNEMEVLAKIFKKKKIPFILIGEKKRCINYVNDTVAETQKETAGTIPEVGKYRGEKICRIPAFAAEHQKEVLNEILEDYPITGRNETGIDIIHGEGGEAAGIQKYLENGGLTREETMSFGDGENDISMLEFAGIGVAMGNASDEVKAHADYVTDSVDNDRIEKALRHFGLIDD